MECDNLLTPNYLKWNNKRCFSENNFFFFHKLYRIKNSGNPIIISERWPTAISCNWSRLINKNDALHQPERYLGDDYDFVFIEELRKYRRTIQVDLPTNDEKNGIHELTCVFSHCPLQCNYSHVEILIRHRIFDPVTNDLKFHEICTHESWENETAYLKKTQAKYSKILKKGFRVDMIKLISRPSITNNISTDLSAFFRLINWNVLVVESDN